MLALGMDKAACTAEMGPIPASLLSARTFEKLTLRDEAAFQEVMLFPGRWS
jgi:hypothetical protein